MWYMCIPYCSVLVFEHYRDIWNFPDLNLQVRSPKQEQLNSP